MLKAPFVALNYAESLILADWYLDQGEYKTEGQIRSGNRHIVHRNAWLILSLNKESRCGSSRPANFGIYKSRKFSRSSTSLVRGRGLSSCEFGNDEMTCHKSFCETSSEVLRHCSISSSRNSLKRR